MRKFIATSIKEYLNIHHQINENTYKVFHGTNDDFDSFAHDKIGSNMGASWNGVGFYFSDKKSEASLYGDKVMSVEIKLTNPIDLTSIEDTSVQGSGLIRFFSNIKGFENVKYNGRTLTELSELIEDLEKKFDPKNISFSDGTNEHFKHVWYDHKGKEYVIRNRTQNEIDNKDWLRSTIISRILHDEHDISGLPIRVKDLMNPYTFTKIAKENGYDGVIAQNSTVVSGNEYVVFDKNNIRILKSPDQTPMT